MIENSWYYLFSTMAQTIASCSALFIAISVIRIQNFENALVSIERQIAESFFKIAEKDEYLKIALIHIGRENWKEYFEKVQLLADSNIDKFCDIDDYSNSYEFLKYQIFRGKYISIQKRILFKVLVVTFILTIIYAGGAIMVIPIAISITSTILNVIWVITGILIISLFSMYFLLLIKFFRPKIS